MLCCALRWIRHTVIRLGNAGLPYVGSLGSKIPNIGKPFPFSVVEATIHNPIVRGSQ